MGQRPRRAPERHHRWGCVTPGACDEDQHCGDECATCAEIDSARVFFSRRRFTRRKARTALDEDVWSMIARTCGRGR